MICKSPNEDYKWTVDWSADIGADTISTSTWTLQSGITNAGDTNTTTTSTIDLSGGTLGIAYELVVIITTAGGDTYEKHLYIKIQNQILG